LKGNFDLQFGNFAVRPIESGIPVVQSRTLSILMTTSEPPFADDSPCPASPRSTHVDNSARTVSAIRRRETAIATGVLWAR
jgi:hypothetical protein